MTGSGFFLGTVYGIAATGAGFLLGQFFKGANTSAPVTPGASGGPVMMKRGKPTKKPKVRDDKAAWEAERESR